MSIEYLPPDKPVSLDEDYQMTTNARDEKWSEWVPVKSQEDMPTDESLIGQWRASDGFISKETHLYDVSVDGGRLVIAYRYKIKEPESDMHPDLEWLARNVSEWGGTRYVTIEQGGELLWTSKPMNTGDSYCEGQWKAARQQLGIDQQEVTPEEEEAWEAKERSLYGEIIEGFDALESERIDNVNKPKHYQLREGYEVYDLRQDLAAKAANGGATYDQYSDWDRAIEYIIRMWGKNRLEDAKKGRWYLDKLIGKLEAEE